jgi:hypothetical protein
MDGTRRAAHREEESPFSTGDANSEGTMKHDPDILISRVVDGIATEADWAGLEQEAQRTPGVWREVAMAQRQQSLLQRQVGEAVAVAERTELPASMGEFAQVPVQAFDPIGVRTRFARVAAWGGWAAAATLALAFISQSPSTTSSNEPMKAGSPLESLRGMLTSEDARNLYLDAGQREGTVLEEVPTKILINVVPSPDGEGGEVTYLRQFIERTKVNDLYQFSLDESGNRLPVSMLQRIKPAM